jgi:hypothetical protein
VVVKTEEQLVRGWALCTRDCFYFLCVSLYSRLPLAQTMRVAVSHIPAVSIHPLVCSFRFIILGAETAQPLGCTICHDDSLYNAVTIYKEAAVDAIICCDKLNMRMVLPLELLAITASPEIAPSQRGKVPHLFRRQQLSKHDFEIRFNKRFSRERHQTVNLFLFNY